MGFTTRLVGELDTVGDWGILTTDVGLTITGWNYWLNRRLNWAPVAVTADKA